MQKAILNLNFYPDAASYDLCLALASYLGVKQEQITVGNGADGLLKQICMTFLEDDDEVIISKSSFPVYDIYAKTMRARIVKTNTKNYGLDLDTMANAITPKTKLIFICNPNNPTGTILTQKEIDSFMKQVPERTLVIFDEAYFEFVDSTEFPKTVELIKAGKKNVIWLRTFSKVYGLAGIRLGYAVGPAELITFMNTIKEPFAVNNLSQAAGIAALQDKEFLQKTVKHNHDSLDYFYKEFERLGIKYVESHGNFVLAEFGPEADKVIQKLLEYGIIVRPGNGYELPTFARISTGTDEHNIRFISTLEKIIKNS
jgi:histidinol-phosphate aminotransferase